MPYQLTWDDTATGQLRLMQDITPEDLEAIAQRIKDGLAADSNRHILIIDIAQTKSLPYPDARIKDGFAYANHPQLQWILIAGTNKLVKLMLLLSFNMANANIRFFDNHERATNASQTLSVKRVSYST